VRVSVRHPWLSAAVWVALTALALWVASGLALKTDLAALLPRTYKSVEQLDRIKEKVGGLERVVFVVESPDSAANHRFAVAIGQAMERRADVSFVEWTRDLSFFQDRKVLPMLLTYRERRSGHPQNQGARSESGEKTAAMASEVEG